MLYVPTKSRFLLTKQLPSWINARRFLRNKRRKKKSSRFQILSFFHQLNVSISFIIFSSINTTHTVLFLSSARKLTYVFVCCSLLRLEKERKNQALQSAVLYTHSTRFSSVRQQETREQEEKKSREREREKKNAQEKHKSWLTSIQ